MCATRNTFPLRRSLPIIKICLTHSVVVVKISEQNIPFQWL